MIDPELFKKMEKMSSLVRGRIIGIYTGIEFLIDDIIQNTLFNDKQDYVFYTELFGLSDKLNGKTKSRIIKHCLEKYDKKYGTNTEQVRERLDNLTDKRDKMAHWILDQSDEGMELYKQKGQFRFMRTKNDKLQEEIITWDTVLTLEKHLVNIMHELIKVQETYSKGNA